MNKIKTTILASVFLLILILIALLSIPKLINLESIKGKVLSEFSKKTGGEIKFDNIDISIIPSPHLVINKGSLLITGKMEGKFKSISVYPELLPLFIGNVQINKIKIESPEIEFYLKEKNEEKEGNNKKFSYPEVLDKMNSGLASLSKKVPNLVIEVFGGMVNLKEKDKILFWFKDLDSRIELQKDKNLIEISCESSVSRNISLKGSFKIAGDLTIISIDNLSLQYPKIDLSGTFMEDNVSQHVKLELNGMNIDVPSTRNAALFFLGDHHITKKIFEVVRGGTFTSVSFNSHGMSIKDLGKADNLLIKGQMVDGEIFIPKADLYLMQVNGSATISNDILSGDNLSAQLGNSHGSEGKLRLGFKGNDAPFTLDILIDGDLKELPPILNRFVKNEDFLNELKLIENIRGNGVGRLVLGDNKSSIKASVNMSDFNLEANYKRIPYLLNIKGGHFLYDKNRIDLKGLRGNFGKTSLSEIEGSLDLHNNSSFKLVTGKSKIHLGEIQSWISTFKTMREFFKKFKILNGTIDFSSIGVSGPILEPSNWSFEAKGEGNLTEPDGPKISIDINKSVDELNINNLKIEDKQSNVSIKAINKINDWDFRFVGDLSNKTLNKVLKEVKFINGWIKGNLRAQITFKKPYRSEIHGSLNGENIDLPSGTKDRLEIEKFSIEAENNKINLNSLSLVWGKNQFRVKGNATPIENRIKLDLDANSDGLDLLDLEEAFVKNKSSKETNSSNKSFPPKFEGVIRLNSKYLKYDRYKWNPFDANITLNNGDVNVVINKAGLCGISTPGEIMITPRNIKLDINPVSNNQDLDATITCLGVKRKRVTGKYDIDGDLRAMGKGESLIRSLKGNVNFFANNGRIYHEKFLLKMLELIQILQLKLPDLMNKGLYYNSIRANGYFIDGKFMLDSARLDSPSVVITGNGNIDLISKKINLMLQVSPLTTVSSLVKKIPLVNKIRRGNLLSIPVRVKGNLSNPEVKTF